MKLVSLAQKYGDFSTAKPEGAETDEYYPCIYFDEKQMKALGVEAARVGTDMTMVASVRVSSMSESKNGSQSLTLEIIEAGLKPKEKDTDAASILFPNG